MKAKINFKKLTSSSLLLVLFLSLAACGGARLNKKFAETQDQRPTLDLTTHTTTLSANLDWIVFRNGPGSWSKDAFWDEYIITLTNHTDETLIIDDVSVLDSTQTLNYPSRTRKSLKKAMKLNKKRYRKNGKRIKIGEGSSETLENSVVAAAIVAGGAGSGSVAVGSGTLTAAGGAIVVAVPAIAVGILVKMANNKKVNEKIDLKATGLPVELLAGESQTINLLYPAVPSPQNVQMTYYKGNEELNLEIDLKGSFNGLHIYDLDKKKKKR